MLQKLLCLLSLVMVSACSEVDPTNPYDPGAPESVQALGRLSGRVRLPDGEPAAGAAVGLAGASVSATTGDDGTFTLTLVPTGGHLLTVSLPCHRPLSVPTPYFEIGDEHTQPDTQLEVATGSILGSVAFAGGPGARFAEVAVFTAGGASARPDETGHFTLEGVRACAGQSISAVAYGYATAPASGLEVPENGRFELPTPLTLVPFPGVVTGRLVLPAGDSGTVEHLAVSVRALGGEVIEGETNAEGGFRLQVPQGPATFLAAVPGYQSVTSAVTVPPAQNDDVVAELGDLRLSYAFERVAGTLTLADGGDPTQARIELLAAQAQYQASPAASGQFEFPTVRAGTYTVRATAFGYAPAAGLPELVVADGAPVTNLELALAIRPGVVCGQLLFPPEPGAPASPLLETAGCPPLDPAQSTLADADVRVPTSGALTATIQADGYFRVEPRAGFHTVEFTRPGYETLQRFNVDVSDDPSAPADLGPLRLDYARAPLSGRVEVEDCPAHPVLVSVVATGPHGTQLVIANIAGASAAGDCVRSGLFDLPDLPVGDYDLFVSSGDYVSQSVHTAVPVPAEAPELAVTLPVNPATLRLVLGAQGLLPVPPETACDAANGVALAALEVALLGAADVAHPDCHGAVVLSGVRAGTYALRLSGGDDYGVLIIPTVTLAPGGETDLGELVLPYATGGLTGRVTVPQGETAENAIITLAGPSSAVAFTGADGAYSFFGVRAGHYVLGANLPGFRPAETTVDIVRDRVGEAPDLDLPLFPGTVRGRIVPEGGGSAAGTLVAVAGTALEDTTDEGSAPGEVPAVLAGTFELTGIRAGTYSLTVSRPADPRYRVGSVPNVLVPAGGDVDVGTLELDRATGAVTVEVTVEDADRLEPEALALVYGAVVGRLASRTPGESTRLEANAYLVANCDAAGRACARIEFPVVPVDAYTLTVEREDYATSTQEVTLDVDGDAVSVDSVLLAILPGQIAGVVHDPEDLPLGAVTVTPAGGAPTTTNAVAPVGAFLAGGLREGSYPVTFTKAGYRTTTLPSIGVAAGLTTDIGTLKLEFATGTLAGTVELGDAAEPGGVLITARLGETVETTVTDDNGQWQLSDVRTGNWLVTATREAYSSDAANATVSEDDVTEVATLRLEVDPGTITGQLVLSDRDPAVAFTDALVEVLPVGGASTHALVDGTFLLSGLKAGTYAISVTLADYDTAEVQGLVVGAGADRDAGNILLHDLKAPAAPTLATDPPFTPLSGQPETPAVVAVAVLPAPPATPELRAGLVPIGFDADADDPAGGDANFNPPQGRGFWQMQVGKDGNWRRVPELRPPFFAPAELNRSTTVRLRGVDAEGNAGAAGELTVMAIDQAAPAAPRLLTPIAGCLAPEIVAGTTTRKCVVNADAVNVPLARDESLDVSFGCYFAQSAVFEARSCAGNADCANPATCQAGQCVDLSAFAWHPGTDDCLPGGTQYVTVFPEESARTILCVRAYDRAGQGSAPACMIIEEDSTVPEAPDLFPNEVEVRGPFAAIHLLLPPDGLDPNLARFEKKASRPGAGWEPAPPDEAASGSFGFDLLAGQVNELSVRAVDRAGNTSESASVFLDETSTAAVEEGPSGLGLSPDFTNGRYSWAHPQGCDQFGQGRLCHYSLTLKDEATQHLDSYPVGNASGCFRGCLSGTGIAPLVAQSSFGLFYTDYVPAGPGDTHFLRVLPYGPDGDPGTGDEALVANVCCANANQNPDSTAGIVWLGATERLVVWVRKLVNGNQVTWRAYALQLDPRQVVAPAAIQQNLYQDADVTVAPDDTPRSFSLVGDTLVFTVGGVPRIWTKITAGANSVISDVSLPADLAGSISLVTATREGFTGVFVPTNLSTERRLVQVGGLRFADVAAADSCPNAACTAQQGCFKGKCFDVARPAGGLLNLACGANASATCGDPMELTSDGGLVAITARVQLEGLDYDRVLLVTGPGASPTLLVTRPGPVHDTVLNFDRLVTVDETSGAPRLLALEPTDLSWRGLDPSELVERAHPRPMGTFTAYVGRRPDGLPGLFLLSQPTPAGGEVTLTIPANAAAMATDVQPWPTGRGFATSGTYLAWTEVLQPAGAVARARLTVIDTAVECAANEGGCTPFRLCTADGATCRAFKQISAETVSFGANLPPVAGRYPLDVAVSPRQVMLHATSPVPANVLSYHLRDSVNGRVHTNLLSAIRGADAQAAGRVTQCDAVGFFARTVSGSVEDRLACLNRVANAWEVRMIVRTTPATSWNSAALTSTVFSNNDATHLGPLGAGSASEVFVIDERTLVLESVVGSGPGQSFPLVRLAAAPPQVLGGGSEEYALLYQRVDVQNIGLGRAVLALPDRIVFADAVLTLQPDIYRMNAFDGLIERLTDADAVQIQPGTTSTGAIMFKDERYFLTAQGGFLPRPAFTLRGLP